MPLPPELLGWLEEMTAEIPKSDRERLEEILSQERVLPKFRKSVLATREFSRKMDELDKDFKKVKDHEQALAQWKLENETALKTNAELASRFQAEAQANALRASELENRLKFYSDQGVIDYTPPAKTESKPVETPPVKPNGKYLTEDDVDKRVRQILAKEERAYSLLPALQQKLVSEHQKLFPGQYPDLVEITTKAWDENKNIEEVWSEKYNVDARRRELETAEREKEIETRAQERLIKLRSEEAMRGTTLVPGQEGSPIFDKLFRRKEATGNKAEENAPVLRPTQRISHGVEEALKAEREGKIPELVERWKKVKPA